MVIGTPLRCCTSAARPVAASHATKGLGPPLQSAHPVWLVQVLNCCSLCQELGVAENLKVHLWVAVGAQHLHRTSSQQGSVLPDAGRPSCASHDTSLHQHGFIESAVATEAVLSPHLADSLCSLDRHSGLLNHNLEGLALAGVGNQTCSRLPVAEVSSLASTDTRCLGGGVDTDKDDVSCTTKNTGSTKLGQ